MSAARRELDEDDVRVRPGRGKSRPRSKDRPGHSEAVAGMVTTVDRGRMTVQLDGDGSGPQAVVSAVKARELGRKGVVVGDRVDCVGEVTTEEPLVRIVRVQPRVSVLRRTADDTDPVERVIVANADQLAVVTALADPEPRTGLIDRCLVAAFDAGVHPLLVLTKADLADPTALLETYAGLDLDFVVTARGGDLAGVRAALAGHTTVLVGHSGVGKSTLVNALVPGAHRSTGAVNTVTGRGRHTSTSALALALPDADGWVIDTPGLRSFGLAHVDTARIVAAFPELAAATDACPRGCTHEAGAPECALDDLAAAGGCDPARLASLRRLLAARADPHAGADAG